MSSQHADSEHHDEMSSENRRRRRPSLFPIQSSVKRREFPIGADNLFNPHLQNQKETKSDQQMSETDESVGKEVGSESQFQFKTPCDKERSDKSQRNQISPSFKDFDAETVFIPLVHQSLTKVVWQNENAIPEERQDIEKKESSNELESRHIKVLDFQNVNKSEGDATIEKLNETYDENTKVLEEQNLEITNHSVPLPKFQLIQEMDKKAERQTEDKEFQKQILDTISVRFFSKEPECQKQEKELVEDDQIMRSEIVQEQFASKAAMHYQNERKNLEKCDHYYEHFTSSANSAKFTFSYLETISVRKTPIKTLDFYQQTERPQFESKNQELITVEHVPLETTSNYQQTQKKARFELDNLETISVGNAPLDTLSYNQQTQRQRFQNSQMSFQKVNPFINQNIKIGNRYFDKVESVKMCNYEAQTSFQDRLLAISKGYDEKIGIIHEMAYKQPAVELFNVEIQTQSEPKKKGFSFSEQVNVMVSFDHEKKLCDQIIGFEKYLKQINEERKKQLLEERAKKSMCKSTNTQNQAQNQMAANKDSNSHRKISRKSFACQYDQKDIGPRPSIKRSSRLSNKQGNQIPDHIQIIQLSDDVDVQVEENKKKKRGRKSKKQISKLKIEFGRDEEEHFQLPEPKSVEKVRRSKRVEKVPKDKKTKKE